MYMPRAMGMKVPSFMAVRPKAVAFLGPNGGRGMTLVEMLTVIVIISILLSVLMPALNGAREASRQNTCSSNLRQIYLGLQTHSQSRDGRLCSGAFDWQRDGSVTSIGWVADLVRTGTPVGKMLCPSNPGQLSETYNDLLNLAVSAWQSESPDNPATWTCGINHKGRGPEMQVDGSVRRDPCEEMISDSPTPSSQRDELVWQRIYREHYNTNFTASWFLVRGSVHVGPDGNLTGPGGTCERTPLARGCTMGPLNLDWLTASNVPSSFIPLMGDGRIVGVLERPFGDFQSAVPVVMSFTRGPVRNPQMDYLVVPTGTPREGPSGWFAMWKATLQDYRGFAPIHRGTANILMADGSIQIFKDTNGDGLLNNGFTVDPSNGFADNTVELPPTEFQSRLLMMPR